jgi:hypothetical protein
MQCLNSTSDLNLALSAASLRLLVFLLSLSLSLSRVACDLLQSICYDYLFAAAGEASSGFLLVFVLHLVHCPHLPLVLLLFCVNMYLSLRFSFSLSLSPRPSPMRAQVACRRRPFLFVCLSVSSFHLQVEHRERR